jgi:hypothetical protein
MESLKTLRIPNPVRQRRAVKQLQVVQTVNKRSNVRDYARCQQHRLMLLPLPRAMKRRYINVKPVSVLAVLKRQRQQRLPSPVSRRMVICVRIAIVLEPRRYVPQTQLNRDQQTLPAPKSQLSLISRRAARA